MVSFLLGGTASTRAAASVDAPFVAQPQVTLEGLPVPHQPDIVVVMADDMRTDDLRFMPAVRHLLRGTGLDFANSFSPCPLCCPARARAPVGRSEGSPGGTATGAEARSRRPRWPRRR